MIVIVAIAAVWGSFMGLTGYLMEPPEYRPGCRARFRAVMRHLPSTHWRVLA